MKHVVGFSGGIDSQACAGLVLERNNPADVVLMNSDAGGNEHPMTTAFVLWYSEHVHPVVMVSPLVRDLADVGTRDGVTRERRATLDENAPMSFADLAFVKGRFPGRKSQFCTEYLKLRPQRRWLLENYRPAHLSPDQWTDYCRYSGVRRDESESRKDVLEEEWDAFYDCVLYRPIASWTKAECFDFCKRRGEEINPLYTLGFSRVGCAPCVNSSKEDIREWAARFPEMIDKVRAWEKQVKRTFFPPVITKLKGKKTGGVNWIDEVVAWARTEHGGQRMSLPFVEADAAAGTCVSKYGLCE